MTSMLWQLILSRAISAMMLIADMIVPIMPQAALSSLTPVLYMASIIQPQPVQLIAIMDFRRGRSGDLLVRGEIASNLSVPIYRGAIRVTGYDGFGMPFRVVTTTAFLPVLLPGQINGFKVILEESLTSIAEIKTEFINWTLTSTQTYLTPSVIFTPSTGDVRGIIFNNTGMTMTNITIATWSLKDQNDYEDISSVQLLGPSQSITFSRDFNFTSNDSVPPASIRVGVQGVASP